MATCLAVSCQDKVKERGNFNAKRWKNIKTRLSKQLLEKAMDGNKEVVLFSMDKADEKRKKNIRKSGGKNSICNFLSENRKKYWRSSPTLKKLYVGISRNKIKVLQTQHVLKQLNLKSNTERREGVITEWRKTYQSQRRGWVERWKEIINLIEIRWLFLLKSADKVGRTFKRMIENGIDKVKCR